MHPVHIIWIRKVCRIYIAELEVILSMPLKHYFFICIQLLYYIALHFCLLASRLLLMIEIRIGAQIHGCVLIAKQQIMSVGKDNEIVRVEQDPVCRDDRIDHRKGAVHKEELSIK